MIQSNRPIHWHEEGLRNWRFSLEEKEKQLLRLQGEVERMRSEMAFYAEQIAEAVATGKVAFDSERFLKARPRKVAS